jgi:uncharacterized protein (DUF1810 family)
VTADHDLERFVHAQDPVWATVTAELLAGRKRSHWIWFVFPQLRGLGRSWESTFYGITGLAEARAYLAHPVLGPRLAEATDLLLAVPGTDAEAILGGIDAVKVRSSMTLFLGADPTALRFRAVLERFYAAVADAATDALLAG